MTPLRLGLRRQGFVQLAGRAAPALAFAVDGVAGHGAGVLQREFISARLAELDLGAGAQLAVKHRLRLHRLAIRAGDGQVVQLDGDGVGVEQVF